MEENVVTVDAKVAELVDVGATVDHPFKDDYAGTRCLAWLGNSLRADDAIDPLVVGLRAGEPPWSMTEDLVQCVDSRLEEVVEVRCVVTDLAGIEAVLDLESDPTRRWHGFAGERGPHRCLPALLVVSCREPGRSTGDVGGEGRQVRQDEQELPSDLRFYSGNHI
jgi:hypothetical protein